MTRCNTSRFVHILTHMHGKTQHFVEIAGIAGIVDIIFSIRKGWWSFSGVGVLATETVRVFKNATKKGKKIGLNI